VLKISDCPVKIKFLEQVFWVEKTLDGGWMGGWKNEWMDGWMEGKAGLRIAYSNQKRNIKFSEPWWSSGLLCLTQLHRPCSRVRVQICTTPKCL
jgi:hypothetical protein